MTISKPRLGILACAAVVGGLMFHAAPAAAGWHGGVWIGVPPIVVAPPVYPYGYYPPAYYPPAYYPPAYYPPAAAYAPPPAATPVPPDQTTDNGQVAYGATCYAGAYVCQAPGSTPVGSGCSCAGLGAPSYGTVH